MRAGGAYAHATLALHELSAERHGTNMAGGPSAEAQPSRGLAD
jgi:hypothetical protein